MDTMGDADELYDHDDVPPMRLPLVTTEALAVTSLTAAVTSLLVTSVSQYLIFLLANALGLGNDGDRNQFAFYIAPVAILSLVGVVCGVVALKRRSDDRWAAALAFAGVAIGGLILLLAAASLLIAYTSDVSVQG
jgi:hypothetical protein